MGREGNERGSERKPGGHKLTSINETNTRPAGVAGERGRLVERANGMRGRVRHWERGNRVVRVKDVDGKDV